MSSKKRAKQPVFIPEAERDLAAKWLATSNLGQPEAETADPEAILRAWEACVRAHGDEGIDVMPEFRGWKRDIAAGDAFCAEEWGKFKAQKEVR